MNIAFCGLKHAHIFALYDMAKANPDTRVLGAWDGDEHYVQDAKAVMGDAFYESYDALLSDARVDVVAIGDAYGARGGEVIRALKAGKHVLCDKPLCTSIDELDEIEALVKQTRLRVGCMLDLRYDPALRLARDMILAGEIGEIHAVNFTGQHPLNYGTRPSWYFDKALHGGTFNDLVIHGLDALRIITGLRYARTFAAHAYNAFAREETDFMDCAQLIGACENGAGVLADVSYSAPNGAAFSLPSYWRFSFWGDRGMIECALSAKDIYIAMSDGRISRPRVKPVAGDCLTDLIKDIRGERATFDHDILFESTRAALTVQLHANNEKG